MHRKDEDGGQEEYKTKRLTMRPKWREVGGSGLHSLMVLSSLKWQYISGTQQQHSKSPDTNSPTCVSLVFYRARSQRHQHRLLYVRQLRSVLH